MKQKIVIIFLCLLSFFIPLTTVSAYKEFASLEKTRLWLEQPEETNSNGSSCFALDVIFIIDQSGSMSGIGINGAKAVPSDPTDQREKAVESMVNWLIENSLDHCKNVRHQVGVVSFGDKARIDLPLTEIAPRSFDAAQQLQNRLAEKIVADKMGDTQPMGAFVLAKDLFSRSTITDDGIQRKRIMIMLTDGMISSSQGNPDGYVKPTQKLADYIEENFKFSTALANRERCIQQLIKDNSGDFDRVPQEKILKCMQDYDILKNEYADSTYLYIVLMNYQEGWSREAKQIYHDVAESHMGELMDFQDKSVENRNAIPEYFRKVLSSMVGVPSGRVSCGPVAVNPYMDKATFVFYKFSADTEVNLTYTDNKGHKCNISGGEVNPECAVTFEHDAYGPNERYVIEKPYPGIWHIESDRCSSDGVSAYYTEVKLNSGDAINWSMRPIQQVEIAPFYDEEEPVYLPDYVMKSDTGEEVDNSPNPKFGVNVIATVVDPVTKDETTYPYKWVEGGRFRAVDPLKVPNMGTYQVSIEGTSKFYPGNNAPVTGDIENTFTETRVLFKHDTQNMEFVVKEVKPFRFEVEDPTLVNKSDQIHYDVTHGWPLEVLPLEVSARTYWVEYDSGNPPVLREILENPESAFVAWIETNEGATERVQMKIDKEDPNRLYAEFEGIDSDLPMSFKVKLEGDVNQDYRVVSREAVKNFVREDSSAWSKHQTYITLLMILIGLTIILAIIPFFTHFDPVQGRLEFYEGTQKMFDPTLPAKKKKAKFKRSDLSGRDLKSLTVMHTPYDKNSDFDGEETKRAIRLVGKTECGQSFDINLESEGESPYCSEHDEYRIKYVNDNVDQKPKLKVGIYVLLTLIPVSLIILLFWLLNQVPK